MKKAFTFFTLLILSFPLFAQHTLTQIRKPTFPGDIRKVVKAGNRLYAAGHRLDVRSFVAVSEDMGASWHYTPSQPFKAGEDIKSIFFRDELNGWAGGDKGVIYKTTDGGASWQEKTDTLAYKASVNDIYFAGSDTGYICGSYNTAKAAKTTDGGESWKEVTLPAITDAEFRTMIWENSLKGILVGTSKGFLSTTDGGSSWSIRPVNNSILTKFGMYSITKSEPGKYFMCGSSGRIMKSTDGGMSFNLDPALGSGTFYSIVFLNSSEGFVAGYNGALYKTTDGGNNWTQTEPFTGDQFCSILPIGGGNIALAGYNGTFFTSSDKGNTWKTNSISSRDFYSAVVKDSLNIIVAGGSSLEGEIDVTHDGGTSWQKMPPFTSGYLRSVLAIGDNLYACGRNGGFYYSANNGSSWENRSSGSTNYKLFFIDENDGYMVSSTGVISKTQDKGTTWTQQVKFTGEIKDIKMVSPSRGFAVGAGDKIYETNDGVSWSHGQLASPNVNLNAIYLLDAMNGYACGQNGAILRTKDGFKTLELLTDTLALKGIQVNDILALNDSTVWAVADKGFILRSHSANEMAVVDTGYLGENLTSISKLKGSSMVLCSSNGAVYKLTDDATVGVRPELKIAGSFDLKQNYPNPFNPETVINFNLASAGYVRLKVFDVLGKEVAVLLDGFKAEGNHSVRFNVLDYNLVSGIYFYRLEAGKFAQTRKMLLIK
ncbi:MAG: YCF48-related protein [Acidobacteriota bacterium]